MSKRVLVTGGAGYIGCVLVPKLLAKGYKVRVLDKMVFGDGGLDTVRDEIEFVRGDIRDLSAPGPMSVVTLRGMDVVIHLAGLSNDPTAEYNPAANRAINTQGTIDLAKQCKAAGIPRFLFASSCSVYYTMEPGDTLRDEEYPINPQAPYSQSKYEAETGLLALTSDTFHPTILRQGTVFGPSPRMRYDLVVNAFTKDAYLHRKLTVHAGGQMWRPMLHIEDVCDAYIACLEAPEESIRGQVFNVLGTWNGTENYQVVDIAEEVQQSLLDNRGIQLDLEVRKAGASRSYRVSGEKFRQTLGWSPDCSIRGAAEDMWDQLVETADPNDPIYYNIRWLELLEGMRERLDAMGGGPL